MTSGASAVRGLSEYEDRGVNPNLFQEEDYRLGSVCNPDEAVRRGATDHLIECVEIGRELGSEILSSGSPTAPTTLARTPS